MAVLQPPRSLSPGMTGWDQTRGWLQARVLLRIPQRPWPWLPLPLDSSALASPGAAQGLSFQICALARVLCFTCPQDWVWTCCLHGRTPGTVSALVVVTY